MYGPRIEKNEFEIYPQYWGTDEDNEWTLEINVDVDGIGCCYRGNISIEYEKLKEFYDYITQQRLCGYADKPATPKPSDDGFAQS